jgi:carboxyl-terminal processing protease
LFILPPYISPIILLYCNTFPTIFHQARKVSGSRLTGCLWYDKTEKSKERRIMFKTTKTVIAIVLVTVIALAFSGGCLLNNPANSNTGDGTGTIKEAWDIIASNYVEPDRLDSANMTRAAIEGIIETLDYPYTAYLTPDEYQVSQSSISGEFDGIGAVVSVRDKNLMIVSPIKDSPAEKAGVKSGDIIQAINDEPTAGIPLDLAVSKIRGPRGTTVRLLILHQGETEPVEITITRARIELTSVNFEMRGDIAYINIIQFTSRTEDEFAPVIKQLEEASARGIVLDLRSNPGGLLDVVVTVASHFIPEGIIVQVRSNQGIIEIEDAVTGLTTTDLPVVVLVDNFSASGSEVLAGALQDHNRALISGNTTYGKGSVNFLYKLSDGSGLYITSSRWLTPNGRLIEGHGIEPDVALELTGEDAVNWAIDYLKNGMH